MSEAPLITPLVPLGEFITKLGRPAGKSALHTYLMRLREQGWDVSQTVRKALHCGATLDKEVCSVCVSFPFRGRLQDKDAKIYLFGKC